MGTTTTVDVDGTLPASFHRLFVAACASNLGDGIRITALPLLAATLTRDPLAIGAVTVATMGPWLLGPVGGTIVDRGDRARLMVLGQTVRGLAVGLLAAAVVFELTSLWMVYLVAAIIGFGEVIVDSATQAAVPSLVRRENLDRANGRLVAGVTVTGEMVGGPLGGVLFAAGAALPFIVDAGTFLLAAVVLLGLHIPTGGRAAATSPKGARSTPGVGVAGIDGEVDSAAATHETSGFWTDVRAGLRHLWDDPLLRPFAIVIGLVNVGLTASISLLVLLALDELQMSEAGYGLLLGISAVGGLVGSLIADRVRSLVGRPAVLTASAVLVAAAMAVLALAPTPVVAGIGIGMVTFAGGTFNVVGRALRQAVIPNELLGRVIASFRVIGIGGVPVGALLGGVLGRLIGVRPTMVVSAGILACAAVAMTVVVRRIPAEHR